MLSLIHILQTVGVKAVLLASDSLPAKQVQQLTELLFSSREALEEQLGLALDPETDAVEGVGIPFHAGAAAWYKPVSYTHLIRNRAMSANSTPMMMSI